MSVIGGITSYALNGWSRKSFTGDKIPDGEEVSFPLPSFLSSDSPVAGVVKEIIAEKVEKLSDEAVLKICRQLEFWYTDGELDEVGMKSLAEYLVEQSTWYQGLMGKSSSEDLIAYKVPKRRFGKTELQMPIVTCGGMRFQCTWFPDFVPLLRPSRSAILNSPPQENIKNCIRHCLALGINHFETARMYGTSEYQVVEALYELIQSGEIKREDFIFQTKLVTANFKKGWEQSWANCKKLGYIDLLGIHAISDINDNLFKVLEVCETLKAESKIRHVGFSTHGCSEQIMALINTEKFEYVNLHEHFFGSYHGSGTPDTLGNEGNLACVKRAKELDMGVFQISPIDKGGKVFAPSKDLALLVGSEMTPISFVLLYAWKKIGFDTSSVGLGRPSDLDEVMWATRLMSLESQGKIDLDKMLDSVVDRFSARAEEVQGKEWYSKGLLNLPSMFDKSTDGIALGHTLWLHNLLTSYGMYDFCKDRYLGLELAKWDKKKSWEENEKSMPRGNPGRSYDGSTDLTEALKNHYDPELALKKIKETHEWLKLDKDFDNMELEKMNWKKGYNLTPWTQMPGEIDSRDINKVLLQCVTGGRLGISKTGPGDSFRAEVTQLREALDS